MITQYISLDFTRKYLAPIYLNQYEADSRDFVITCTAGQSPINLAGSSVVFYATKPDDTILFNSCTIVDAAAGKIQYTPTEQTCAASGALTCQIVIIASDSSVLRSMEFTVTVNPGKDYSEAVESTSEYTALDEALALTTGFDARITQNESDIATNTTAIGGKVDGAGTVVDGHIVQFDGTTGKAIKGGLEVTTTVADPGANTKLPTEAAVRAAIEAACGGDVSGPASATDGAMVAFDGTSGKLIKEAVRGTDYAKAVQFTATLTAAGWSNDEQTVNNAAIYSATCPVIFDIDDGATTAQVEAFADALIVGESQSTGSIVLKAHGGAPAIDLPIKGMAL
jgi:archaellin